jgi:hypothetical protein
MNFKVGTIENHAESLKGRSFFFFEVPTSESNAESLKGRKTIWTSARTTTTK